jgi:hypothetical protein
METISEYQRLLDTFDHDAIRETLRLAGDGIAPTDDDRRLLLEFLHRKRFIDLELALPRLPGRPTPELDVSSVALTASGERLLDWIDRRFDS